MTCIAGDRRLGLRPCRGRRRRHRREGGRRLPVRRRRRRQRRRRDRQRPHRRRRRRRPASRAATATTRSTATPASTASPAARAPTAWAAASKRDILAGGCGRDALFGSSGNDAISGGSGNDRISGGSGGRPHLRQHRRGPDHAGQGQGPGHRRRAAMTASTPRDGKKDRISCGSGRDRVTADNRDVLTGCERDHPPLTEGASIWAGGREPTPAARFGLTMRDAMWKAALGMLVLALALATAGPAAVAAEPRRALQERREDWPTPSPRRRTTRTATRQGRRRQSARRPGRTTSPPATRPDRQ